MNRTEAEAARRRVAERLWLHHYNQLLFDRGMITEAERNRVARLIDARW